jgi:hypothetical protein
MTRVGGWVGVSDAMVEFFDSADGLLGSVAADPTIGTRRPVVRSHSPRPAISCTFYWSRL